MRRRGFSLLEVLIVMLLLLIVLGVSSDLLRGYSAMMDTSRTHEAGMAAQVTLGRMAADLREAVLVVSPTGTGEMDVLGFQKIDPSRDDWLPVTLPTPVPATWDPQPASMMLLIEYRLDGDRLVRESSPAGGGDVDSWGVAEDIRGFAASSPAANHFRLTLSVQGGPGNVVTAYSTDVWRPVP